jgi:hypothetical protein
MKWVEIIYLRSVGKQQKALIHDLKKQAALIDQTSGLVGVKIYHHATLNRDLAIMIHGKSDELKMLDNTLGLHLESLLKEFGLVNRSVWVEE